jgi:hypothetical protein
MRPHARSAYWFSCTFIETHLLDSTFLGYERTSVFFKEWMQSSGSETILHRTINLELRLRANMRFSSPAPAVGTLRTINIPSNVAY